MEIDLNNLAVKIFTRSNFDEKIQVSFETLGLKDLFEMLLTLLTEGLKIFFGDANNKINLDNLNTEDFILLNKCLNKLDFSVNIEKMTIYEFITKENYKNYSKIIMTNNTKLHDLKMEFHSGNHYYVVSFKNKYL